MKKRIKPRSKWLSEIRKKVITNSSKNQPYEPQIIPYALKHYKRFFADSKSPSFKNQGGSKFFLLERARKFKEKGEYEQEWLNET